MGAKPTIFLASSILIAMALLALLLVVATAPTSESLRKLVTHLNYLDEAVTTSESMLLHNSFAHNGAYIERQSEALNQALVASADTVRDEIRTIYLPSEPLPQARWTGVELINMSDVSAGARSPSEVVVSLHEAIATRIDTMTDRLNLYRAERTEHQEHRIAFSALAQQVATSLRELGSEQMADQTYILARRIETLVSSYAPGDLDEVFAALGELEAAGQNAPSAVTEQMRALVSHAFTLTSLRRSMNEAIAQMELDTLKAQVNSLQSLVRNDQAFTAGAIGDARILLNIYTVLLLGLLAFFGRRLQSSYKALNRSHDDLEQRVEERTADLATANDNLKESQVQLVQAEKMSSLGQLVAGVMHEINTPLLYIQNNTTMTGESVGELAEFLKLALPMLKAQTSGELQQSALAIARNRRRFDADELEENLAEAVALVDDSLDGINQISELVQSLKDFSRLDRVADDRFDVRQGIEKTLVITRNMLKQGVTVNLDLHEVPEIYCSPSRLNQVFINLVTNAVQAMDGEGELHISTQPSTDQQGHPAVEICFTDTGCGIAQEHLDKIMDPFFTTKPVGQGTGLGLSIVRQSINQHHGEIRIDSVVDQGTTISLILPCQKSDEQPGAEAA